MRSTVKLLLFIFLLSSSQLFAQKIIKLTSPNGNIIFNFKLENNKATYAVSFKGKTIVDYSSLSLDFENGKFENNLTTRKPVYKDTSENYELIVGKTKNVHSHYNEVTIPLEEIVVPQRKINLVVRAFNDGVAFRYEFPQQQNWSSFTLLDENTTFNLQAIQQCTHCFFLIIPPRTKAIYSTVSIKRYKEDTLMDMPAYLNFPTIFLWQLPKQHLLDYAGMY